MSQEQINSELLLEPNGTIPTPQELQEPTIPDNNIGVVSTVWFRDREAGASPHSVVSRWSRMLNSREQVYVRKTRVGPEWTNLNLGWLQDQCGLLVIVNNEGSFTQRQPTGPEREEAAKKILEIATASSVDIPHPFTLVFPQEDMRVSPERSNYRIRSQYGDCRFTIYAYPR